MEEYACWAVRRSDGDEHQHFCFFLVVFVILFFVFDKRVSDHLFHLRAVLIIALCFEKQTSMISSNSS